MDTSWYRCASAGAARRAAPRWTDRLTHVWTLRDGGGSLRSLRGARRRRSLCRGHRAGRRMACLLPLLVCLALVPGSCSDRGCAGGVPGANGPVAFAVEKWRLPDPCLPAPHGCEPEVFSSSIETVLPSGRARRVLRTFPPEQGLASRAGVVAERQVATFPQASRMRSFERRRGLAAAAAADRLRCRAHLVADGRRLAFVGRSVCCSRLYSVRPTGRPSASSPRGGPLACLVDDGPDRVRQLRRPERRNVWPEGRDLRDQPDGSRLRRLSVVTRGTGQQPDWSPMERDRVRRTPAHLHHEGRRAPLRRLRLLRRQRPGLCQTARRSPSSASMTCTSMGAADGSRATGVDGADQDLDRPTPPGGGQRRLGSRSTPLRSCGASASTLRRSLASAIPRALQPPRSAATATPGSRLR